MLWGDWKKNKRALVKRQEKRNYGIKELVVSSQDGERESKRKFNFEGQKSLTGQKNAHYRSKGGKEKFGSKNLGTEKKRINGKYLSPMCFWESACTH